MPEVFQNDELNEVVKRIQAVESRFMPVLVHIEGEQETKTVAFYDTSKDK